MDTTAPLTSLHTRIRQDLLSRFKEFSRRLDAAKELSREEVRAALLLRAVREARAGLEECQHGYAHAVMTVGMPGGPAGEYARRRIDPFLQAFAEELAAANAELVGLQECEALPL